MYKVNKINRNVAVMMATFVLIGFSSCEKDGTTPNGISSNTKNQTSNTNKSGDEVDVELSNFIDVMVQETDLPYDMEASKALIYTEAALEWRIANPDAEAGVTKVFNFQYPIQLNSNNGEWEFDGAGISTLNQQIYDELEQAATNYNAAGFQSGSKFWTVIDVVVPENSNYSNNYTVEVVAVLAGVSSASAPVFNCLVNGSYPIAGYGSCNNSTPTSPNLAAAYNVVGKNCSALKNVPCNSFLYVQYNVHGKWVLGTQSAGSFFASSTNPNYCVTENYSNNFVIPGAIAWYNNNIPIWGNTWKKRGVFFDVYTGGSSPYIYTSRMLGAYYQKCVRVAITSLEMRPTPFF